MGPIASQEAIKMIGTNGGGFLNTNSAHPFENPSAWSNLLQMLVIFLIPAGLCLAFGQMVGDKRLGWALLSAIGVAGMSRMLGANVIATSGRAVEAAGDVDVPLLDKTGTITLGNRQASAFLPAPSVSEAQLADAAQLSSLADETPEGRSIVVLARWNTSSPPR